MSDVELKSERLKGALERATAGDVGPLAAMLVRMSGLPGTRPNLELAFAMGEAIADAKATGDPITSDFAARPGEHDAPTVFLRAVAGAALAVHAARGRGGKETWERLFALASDDSLTVRLAIEHAMIEACAGSPTAATRMLQGFATGMTSYGSAGTVMLVLAERRVIDAVTRAETYVVRLDEGFALAESATRAAERDPDHRRLLDALSRAIAASAGRIRGVTEWLEERARTEHRLLREVIERAIDRAEKAGVGRAELVTVKATLDEHAPPVRERGWDPTQQTRRSLRARGRKR